MVTVEMTETLRTESWDDRVLVAEVWLTMAEDKEAETLETLLLVAALRTEDEVAAEATPAEAEEAMVEMEDRVAEREETEDEVA